MVIAQGKGINSLGLMCSVSFDYMSSPNGEMQMMLATFEMKKQDGMKVFHWCIFFLFSFSVYESCTIMRNVTFITMFYV
jgi:hypothetical protein